ncbi:MAG TPA: hypothetical protein VIY90_19140 [Steroidobacteraceae bacterium]
MRWLKTILTEIFGLFVDDIRFALAIIIWLALVRLGLPRLNLPAGWNSVILFTGLATILAESALRTASRKST